MRGLGQTDVTALANACSSGSIQPTISLLTYTNPIWGATNVGEEQIDSGSAQQIAGLLNLNAQNLPMTTTYNLPVGSTDISDAWYINVDGMWANLADLGNECANGPQGNPCQMANLLASMIPGSTVNSACASSPPYGDIQSVASETTPSGDETVVAPYTPTYASSAPATTTAPPATSSSTTNGSTITTAPSSPASTSTASNTVAPLTNNIASSTPTSVAQTSSSGSTSASTSSSDDWLTQSLWDGIPNWGLLAGGAIGLILLMNLAGGRR